jgi:hypothetical protein
VADKKLNCPACGKDNIFSEYARGEQVCRFCGVAIDHVPTGMTSRRLSVQRRSRPSLENEATPAETAQTVEEADFKKVTDHAAGIRNRRKLQITHCMASWVLFLVLGGAAVYLRYGGKLTEPHLELLKTYSPHTMAGIWLLILTRAFRDSVFAGIAAFLCPPISFYYLFMQSGDFYLRAVIGALLIAISEDAAVFYYQWFLNAIDFVKEWLYYGALH